MSILKQSEIDDLSDALKRAHAEYSLLRIPETPVAAWFVNTPHGPEFWVGQPGQHAQTGVQPLFYEKATPGQGPVAFRAEGMLLITVDINSYRDDIVWKPLYPARSWTPPAAMESERPIGCDHEWRKSWSHTHDCPTNVCIKCGHVELD